MHAAQRIRYLEEETRNLNNNFAAFIDDFNALRSSLGQSVSTSPLMMTSSSNATL